LTQEARLQMLTSQNERFSKNSQTKFSSYPKQLNWKGLNWFNCSNFKDAILKTNALVKHKFSTNTMKRKLSSKNWFLRNSMERDILFSKCKIHNWARSNN
jgi:hypothetical protein